MSTICCAWKRRYTAALNPMLRQPNGIWLLGIVTVGLIALGFYFMLIGRVRPPTQIWIVVNIPDFSSGHAVAVIVFYGMLAYLLVPKVPSAFWKGVVVAVAIFTMGFVGFIGFIGFLMFSLLKPSVKRSLILVFIGNLVVLIGTSRIYLGEHRASDALGAYLLGSLTLVAIVQFYTWGKTRFFVHQPVAVDQPQQP